MVRMLFIIRSSGSSIKQPQRASSWKWLINHNIIFNVYKATPINYLLTQLPKVGGAEAIKEEAKAR